MANKKEIKKIIKEAEKNGWYLHRSKKHFVYKHPNGGTVTVSKSTCTYNACREIRKNFRECGR